MRREPIIRSAGLRIPTRLNRELRVRTAALPDEQLFNRFQQDGDRKAFEELVRRWHVSAFRIARTICRDKVMGPGNMVEMWNGRDNKGRLCLTGLYIVLIDAGGNENKLTVSVLND